MKTRDHINQAHEHGQQAVKGTDIKVDLGPAADLLHWLAAYWLPLLLLALAIGAALWFLNVAGGYVMEFGIGNMGGGVLNFAGIASILAFGGYFLAAQSFMKPHIAQFLSAVQTILGGA